MVEPHWTSYVGMFAGIVGAVMAAISLRRTFAVKALDLRVELGKELNEIDGVLGGLDSFLERVRNSRLRVMSATGDNNSGAMQIFEEDFKTDMAALSVLKASQPRRPASYQGFSHQQLEAELLAAHRFLGSIRRLREKYEALYEQDEGRRKEIRATFLK